MVNETIVSHMMMTYNGWIESQGKAEAKNDENKL
jgi:hypothetical protein